MTDVKSFPTLQQWDDAGIRIKPIVYKDLDPNHWEGRFHIFVRMCVFNKLEEDSRVPFYKWIRDLKFTAPDEFFAMFPLSEEEMKDKDEIWEDYLSVGLPPYLMARGLTSWEKLYPAKEYVKITKIGKFVYPILESMDKDVEKYIESYASAFLREVEFIYKSCVKNKDNYKNLNFDWSDLLQKKYNLEQLASFHRHFYGSNILSDITCIYQQENMVHFMSNFVFVALLKDFNIDIDNTIRVDKSINGELHNKMEVESGLYMLSLDEECDPDFDPDDITKTKVWADFKENFGTLWSDNHVKSF